MYISTIVMVFILTNVKARSIRDFIRCYDPKLDFSPYLSTKSAYELVHGNITRPKDNCQPIQIWMMTRHGTRYPRPGVVTSLLTLPNIRDQIIQNHVQGDGQLCPEDLEKLRDWKLDPNVNNEMATILTPQGEEDLRQLGKRMYTAFPDLLQTHQAHLNYSDYEFRSTDTQRTRASMKYFIEGLFDNQNIPIQSQISYDNDTLLRLHKNCPSWKRSYNEENVNEERDKFTAGPEMQSLLDSVSERLGFTNTLDFDTVRKMYDMCRFETAWHINQTSTWCRVFGKEGLKILEYREDLNYYYYLGPGREINRKLGCPPLKNMFEHFNRLENGNEGQPRGIFYFAHTSNLHLLLAALKISQEPKPLLSTNYAAEANRTYRTSLLGPFATSVAAVFYRCEGEKPSNKVAFYVAERLVQMKGCNNGLCDWNYLKQEFAPLIEECQTNFCQDIFKNGSPDNKIVGLKYLFITMIPLIFHNL